LIISLATVSSAQSDVLGVSRPVKGVNRAALPAPEPPAPPAAIPHVSGVTVPLNSKLTAGDTITVEIEEDHDPALTTVVTDTGEVELNGLGRVYVSGRTTTEAAALVAAYLKQKYYHRATVKIGIKTKALGAGVRPFKVLVTGKVGRPGPQYFTDATPLKLAEAVTVAGTGPYSEIKKVKLTRGGRNTEHDVRAIIKEGRPDLDVELKDGDSIYVPAVGIRFGME
jgi:protein involved in polysaccharide export with SLBB domain